MNILQDLLDGHFNASVDVHNSRQGNQPNSVIVDAWEAFCKAEDAIREYCDRERQRGYAQALNSLTLGVEAEKEGAAVSLMSVSDGVTTVLACGYTQVNKGNIFKVSV